LLVVHLIIFLLGEAFIRILEFGYT
jgi:hypothetical protein